MKRIKDILKCRELLFLFTVYPSLIIFIINIKKLLMDLVNKHYFYYGMIALACSVFIIIYVLLEIITKLYNYELQGDKLKIRQQEGINIEELNNGR